MENISQYNSLPKRSFNGAFTSHKSVYDDVFGAGPPPKFGALLAPRLEDYSEIFGGFHASSRSSSSSIPVLHLPLIGDDPDLHFDVQSPGFDYTEIFGGDFRPPLPFSTPSFQDLVRQSSPGYSSSHDPWSPAQSASFSDELEPLAGSDKGSRRLSDANGDDQSLDDSTQLFNVFYNKSRQTTNETVLTGTSHATNCGVVPGYTFSDHGEDEYCSSSRATDDSNSSKEFGARVGDENALHCGSSAQGSDFNPLRKDGKSISPRDKPFMTVSDISLRTKPSRLPPPSRPPPPLVVKKEECDRSGAKLEASKSYAFERLADDSAPLFFEVTEDVMNVEGKTNKTVKVSSSFEDENMLQSHGKETSVSELVTEDMIGSTKRTENTSEPQEFQYSNHNADSSDGCVAWTEATEYFEVIDKTICRRAFETIEDCDTHADAYRHPRTTDSLAFDQDNKKFKVRKEAPRWDENRKQPEMGTEDGHLGDNLQTKTQNRRLSNKKDSEEKVILNKLATLYDSNGMVPENVQRVEESATLQDDHETEKGRPEAMDSLNEVEANTRLKASVKKIDITKRNIRKHEEHIVRDEFQRRLEDVEGAETRERVKKIIELEINEGACVKGNKNKPKESSELKENERILQESKKHGESAKKSYVVSGDERLACELEKDKERLMEGGKQKLNRVETKGEQELALQWEAIKERNGNASKAEDNNLRCRTAETEAGGEREVSETKGNNHLHRDAAIQEELCRHDGESEITEKNGYEREVKWDPESDVLIEGDQLKSFDGASKLNEGNAIKFGGKHDNHRIWEATQASILSDGAWELKTEVCSKKYEPEVGMDDPVVKGNFNRFRKNKDELQDRNTHCETNTTEESHSLTKQKTGSNTCDIGMGVSCIVPEKIISTEDNGWQKTQETQFITRKLDVRDSFTPCQVGRESLVNGMKLKVASPVLELNDDTLSSSKNSISQRIERNEKNMKENLAAKDQKEREKARRETELENEHMRKIEEEREREREREKDRMAVDKAAFEARERSYAEARERADRAAMERASTEVRQRALAEARERLEKASMEARLRTERAAVERATIEARQRAAEKLMADKAAFASHNRAEKFVADRFSASLRSADTRQSSFSSDFHYKSSGTLNGLRNSYSSAHCGGAEGESPQRSKARLERYRRTAERAANALAEKNKRDLLAQREREERNRVAESLDAEVKRWSNGKEGNLRALLSTLQYILGPGSGWQPVPLTEVITSAAVKKAYRKATLCVHPDKLQQRGATVQQKYVCEKVFDLLKEAWNKFNSEER